jgi:hypothetical protein
MFYWLRWKDTGQAIPASCQNPLSCSPTPFIFNETLLYWRFEHFSQRKTCFPHGCFGLLSFSGECHQIPKLHLSLWQFEFFVILLIVFSLAIFVILLGFFPRENTCESPGWHLNWLSVRIREKKQLNSYTSKHSLRCLPLLLLFLAESSYSVNWSSLKWHWANIGLG